MEPQKEKVIEPEVCLELTKEEKTMAMLVHILPLICGFIFPLIIYLTKKDESAFVDDQTKESLNFQITGFFIYIAFMIFGFITCFYGFILFPLLLVIPVFCIIAGIKANEGIKYRYPMNIRMIK